MKTLRLIWLAALIAAMALIPSMAGATPTHHLSASGGVVRFSAAVKNGKTCTWSSSPRLPSLDQTVKCRTGDVARQVRFSPNTSTTAKSYVVTLTVRGTTTSVHRWIVDEAGVVVSTVAPPTTTTTTTTTAPPTTTTTTTVPVTTTAPTMTLAVTDPTYTQNSTNPLIVTYTYSASATETVDGITGFVSPVPQGILDFYSDGLLACSTNVGGSVSTAQCTVTYSATGAQTVVTEYLSGTNSVSATDTVDIEPLTTITQVSFVPGSFVPGPTEDGPGMVLNVDLLASVTDQDGQTITPAAGALSFNINGFGTFTTMSSGQTECTLLIEHSEATVNGLSWLLYASNCAGSSITGCVACWANGGYLASAPTSLAGTGDFAASADYASSEGSAEVTLPSS